MIRRLALLLALVAPPALAADPAPPLGTTIADFTLPDAATGQAWGFAKHARGAKAVVVLFPSAACPVSLAYLPVVQALAAKYQPDGVRFVAVYSHDADDAATVAKQAKAFGLTYPTLKDDGTTVADKFRVDRVPTAFVLDAGRTVRYHGRIDDQFAPGVHRPKATTRDLGDALDAVLAGTDVKVPQTAAAGCKLTRDTPPAKAAGQPVTYTKHVAPIVQAKCQECHRAGEAAPFALDGYKAAKSWSAMIREVVADNVMPPWHADAAFGHFKNDRRLSPADKATLLAWIDQGCVEGDAKDLPAPRTFLDGWRLPRQPDEVLKLEDAQTIPASAPPRGMSYRYLPVGKPLTEDRWVEAVEVRPQYRAVVHHVICFIVPSGKSLRQVASGRDFGTNMLAAYVPGDAPLVLPKDHARKVPKGSQLVFEVHYTPNGQGGTDQSMIGLCYAKGPPKYEVHNQSILDKITLLPEKDNQVVTATRTFVSPATLHSFTPHMHLRGKAFKFELVMPGGEREVLCNVPKYDFNWQATYELAKPRDIPALAQIECTAWYDNSAGNPFNPDPTATVTWGNQTWEEMMIGFVVYTGRK